MVWFSTEIWYGFQPVYTYPFKFILNEESYLIKDGSLQYKPLKSGDFRKITKIRNNYRCVVGVSKQFNPELIRDKNDKSNASSIARLPIFHRTPAFMYVKPKKEKCLIKEKC